MFESQRNGMTIGAACLINRLKVAQMFPGCRVEDVKLTLISDSQSFGLFFVRLKRRFASGSQAIL